MAVRTLKEGTKIYYYGNDIWHRDDGPAVVRLDGTVKWWYNDEPYTFNEWREASQCSPELAVILKLQYG